jgi:glycosyltransferase involved in cell wall biosynthesis
LNILFALYYDFTSNSATHVHSLANELVALGNECLVAVPENKASLTNLAPARFRAVEFSELHHSSFAFSNGRGPDIIHAWTPRENVRSFCEAVRQTFGSRLFVHLEDNEWHLLSCELRLPFRKIAALPPEEMDRMVPGNLSHPHRALEFLKGADGITVIIEKLKELAPPDKPVLELWPSAQQSLFGRRAPVEICRRTLRIPRNSTVLVYTGNVHSANAHEMRSLYLAVAILNREGHPATLVRAGADSYPFLAPDDAWARRHSIELGSIPHTEVPALLALADVLVQPGRADDFNDYRFPSKVPEYLSIGRPVILPNANIARHMKHRKDAYILQQANGLNIANAVRDIMCDSALYRDLADGALRFFKEYLSWSRSAKSLNDFYRQQREEGHKAPHMYATSNQA